MEGVEGAIAKLRASAIAYARFFEIDPQYLEVFIQERAEFRGVGPQSHRDHHEKMIAKIGDVLAQGIASGELRPVDTRQTTIAMGCLLYGTTVLGSHLQSGNVVQLAGDAIDIFFGGPAGRGPLSRWERSQMSATLTDEPVASPSLPSAPRVPKTTLSLEPAVTTASGPGLSRWLWIVAIVAAVGIGAWWIPALLGTRTTGGDGGRNDSQ